MIQNLPFQTPFPETKLAVEVPIVISYGTQSKKDAVPHGVRVLINVLKYLSINHARACLATAISSIMQDTIGH